jgi:hypothetical protein
MTGENGEWGVENGEWRDERGERRVQNGIVRGWRE